MSSDHTSDVNDASGDLKSGVWTVVVAGGSGSRFGAPKQFVDLGGLRVIDRSVSTAAKVSSGVVVVLPDSLTLGYSSLGDVPILTAAGGPTRSASVRNGLQLVPEAADVVLVHDGARPLATEALFARLVAAVRGGAQAAVPVVPIVDSVRHRQQGAVDRDQLVAVQTPQGFTTTVLRAAHDQGRDASDDATLVEHRGVTVVHVDGEADNLKITTRRDLALAEVIVGEREPSNSATASPLSREDPPE